MKDYYKILGIDKNASSEEIKKAYRKLAHQYHPDKRTGDENKFKEINEAYQILSDKEKRSQYDQFGSTFDQPQSGFSGFEGFGQQGFDFGEDLGDIFEQFFSFGRKRPKDTRKGSDIQVDIELSLENVLKDQEKTFVINKFSSCSRCNGSGAEPGTSSKECFSCRGTGRVQQIKRTFLGTFSQWTICPECNGEGKKPEKPCNVCKGEGRTKKEEKINIFIPAGVDTGQTIKVNGQGEAGKRGAKPGDLYCRIFIKKHNIFQRKGDDLLTTVSVSFPQVALGEEIEITTLEGKILLLKIPAGTESGKIFRISGKGIPHFSRAGRGDLYIKINVKIPKKLTKKQKQLLEELKKEEL
ncbi:MAG: molecular chaperone DnaJ [Candidatus Pacebacteria bacterium]|nr:molecular chaperone DnaJ [Candidatus Paceibacterota bacterium]